MPDPMPGPSYLPLSVLAPEHRAAVPYFAAVPQRPYRLMASAEGRLYLHDTVEGADVYVAPKAWATLRYSHTTGAVTVAGDEAGAKPAGEVVENFGLNLESMPREGGVLNTNDPNFGPVARDVFTQERCPEPMPDAAPAPDFLLPLAVVVAAILLAVGFSRRKS